MIDHKIGRLKDKRRAEGLATDKAIGKIAEAVKAYRQIFDLGGFRQGDMEGRLLNRLEQVLKEWEEKR